MNFEQDVNNRVMEKLAAYNSNYDKDSLSAAYNNPDLTSEELSAITDKKIQEFKNRGDYVTNSWFSRTVPSHNWALGNLIRRVANNTLGTTFKVNDPKVLMQTYSDSPVSNYFTRKVYGLNPTDENGLNDKLNKYVGAHEILEAESMKKHPKFGRDYDIVYGLGQLGVLGSLGYSAYKNIRNANTAKKELAAWAAEKGIPYTAKWRLGEVPGLAISTLLDSSPVLGMGAGMLTGAGIAYGLNALNGGPHKRFYSHMGSDIIRLENNLAAKLKDPEMVRALKDLRNHTRENDAFVRATGHNYGTKYLDKSYIDKLQKYAP